MKHDRSVSIDSVTRLVPEPGGWRVVTADGKRSRAVYGTQAAALRAVCSELVRWEAGAGRRSA